LRRLSVYPFSSTITAILGPTRGGTTFRFTLSIASSRSPPVTYWADSPGGWVCGRANQLIWSLRQAELPWDPSGPHAESACVHWHSL
jgi:hypothetical protein